MEIEKVEVVGPARILDHGPKIGIFRSKPLHITPIKNRPKTAKSADCSISTIFCQIFRLQHETLTVTRPKHLSDHAVSYSFMEKTFLDWSPEILIEGNIRISLIGLLELSTKCSTVQSFDIRSNAAQNGQK